MPDRVSVTYAAFGAMAVTVDGVRHALTRGRDRGVLAVLLAAHGAPVAAERVVAEVWGLDAPPTALGMLQVSVSRLRSLLEPDRASRTGTRLVSTGAGYAVNADRGEVDTWAFEAAAAAVSAAESPAEAMTRAEEAERGWTGDPYAGCTAPAVVAEADRLKELRLVVQEARARAMLDSGHPVDAALLLTPLAPTQPYREGLWCLLALAQYQSARQAEALETLRTLRTRLAEDLGVDPSEQAQSLERSVLAQDVAIAAPAPPTSTTTPAAPATAAPGRARSTAVAAALLDDARTSVRTRLLAVSGEAGIGKSRLVDDLAAIAAKSGFAVLVGRCHEGDYAPPLWPWVTIVRGLPGAADAPELAPLLTSGSSTDLSGGSGLRMFDAVAELLTSTARSQPLLLVLEDIHWADATTLQLLRHLAAAAPAAPLVVVTTRRTADGHPPDDLVDTMAALARAGAERLPLDGLDTASVATLLGDAVGPHDPRLDERVAEVTGGNPFFVLQYARLLEGLPDLDVVDPSALPMPEGVRDVLHQRLRRLPEATATTLAAAAVVGPFVDPDVLADLTGSSVPDLLDRLDLAVIAGLLEERGAGYAFVHALARDAVASTLTAARRMRLHDAAATVLEARLGSDPDTAATIAHHAHQAAPLGSPQAERATRWLARAASLAASRHAHAEALALWDQALTAAQTGTEAAYDAHCGKAAALLRLARIAEAREETQRAAQLALALGRPDLVAGAVGLLNGAGVWSWREHGTLDEDFVALLRAAAEQADPRDESRLLAALQMELSYGEVGAPAEAVGARSVELAREAGNVDVLREVLLVRALSLWGPGSAPERLGLIEELLDLEPESELRALVLFRLGGTLFDCARPEESDAAMRECTAAAAALRHTGLEIPLAWWAVARARDREDPDVAELTSAALDLHRASEYIGSDELECLAAVRLLRPGQIVPDDVVTRARPGGPAVRAVVALALLDAGATTSARELLGSGPSPGASDYSVQAALCLRVLVLAALGPRNELAEGVARLEPYAGTVASYGTVDHLGATDYFLAVGHRALDDPRAPAEAAAAVELTAATGVRPWHRKAVALLASLSTPRWLRRAVKAVTQPAHVPGSRAKCCATFSAGGAKVGRKSAASADLQRGAMTTSTTTTETRGNTSHAIADLRRRVGGTVHTPDEPTWDHARMAWVVNVDQQPLAVLEVRDADDVQAAVRWAVDHGVDVSAQPTGHSPATGAATGVLLLRTRALGEIEVDVQRRSAWVGAGVKSGELLSSLDGTGLTFLAGSNPDPTVVGMTITGGISWFGRAYGLGCDSVLAVELVDGLGRLRRLSATEEPELFWAVRGGGGSFGIITRVEVALHPAARLYGGRLLWPLDRMAEVLEAFRTVSRTAPPELTVWFQTYQFPPFPELPEPIRGKSFVSVAAAYLGDDTDAEDLLAPLRAVDGVVMDLMGEVPMSALGSIADEPTEPMPGMQSSHLVTELDDRTAAALVGAVGPGSGSPLTVFQIRHLGAAFAGYVTGPGAHGPVEEPYVVFALGVPAAPELVPAIQDRFRRIAEAVAPVDSGRKLLNFLNPDEDPALWWSPETRTRLAAAKQVADPLGIIRSNRSIRP